MLGLHPIERDPFAADRASNQKSPGLDPIGNNVVLRTMQFLDPFDDDPAGEVSSDLLERSMALYSRLKELAEIGTQAIQYKPVSTDTQLSYRLVAGLPAELDWQQRLLELRSERERLTLVVHYFEELIKELESAPNKRSTPSQKIAGIHVRGARR